MVKDSACVFCKIVAGEVPTEFVKQTGELVVFNDIHPSAPVHILIVPKKHYEGIDVLPDKLWIEAKNIALELAKEKKMKGFRFLNNYGTAAMIGHIHIHLLSGITKRRKV